MLILGRSVGERIIIEVPPSKISTTVIVEMCEFYKQAGSCRLGITADPKVIIYRQELENFKRGKAGS